MKRLPQDVTDCCFSPQQLEHKKATAQNTDFIQKATGIQ